MAGADCRINLRPCSRLRVDRKVFALVAIRVTLVASRQLSCGRSRVGRRRVPVDSDCVDCLWRGAGGAEGFKARNGNGEGGGCNELGGLPPPPIRAGALLLHRTASSKTAVPAYPRRCPSCVGRGAFSVPMRILTTGGTSCVGRGAFTTSVGTTSKRMSFLWWVVCGWVLCFG